MLCDVAFKKLITSKRLFRGELFVVKYGNVFTTISIESTNFACDRIKISFVEQIDSLKVGDKLSFIRRADGENGTRVWVCFGEGEILGIF